MLPDEVLLLDVNEVEEVPLEEGATEENPSDVDVAVIGDIDVEFIPVVPVPVGELLDPAAVAAPTWLI